MEPAESSHSNDGTHSASSASNAVTGSVLSARDVGKRYAANWVLRGANLTLKPGQILALLGENGAGKSTFVKILSGAIVPDEGDVTLVNHPLPLGRPDAARRTSPAMSPTRKQSPA